MEACRAAGGAGPEFDGNLAVGAVDAGRDLQVVDTIRMPGGDPHGPVDAAVGKEVEAGGGIILVGKDIVGIRGHVAGRDAIGGERAVYAHDQPVLLRPHERRDIKLKGQVAALVAPGKFAVDPDRSQVIDRTEAEADLAALPAPRQIERGLVPGEAQVVVEVEILVVPAGGHGDGAGGGEAPAPSRRSRLRTCGSMQKSQMPEMSSAWRSGFDCGYSIV